jgi:hypothetical protein
LIFGVLMPLSAIFQLYHGDSLVAIDPVVSEEKIESTTDAK